VSVAGEGVFHSTDSLVWIQESDGLADDATALTALQRDDGERFVLAGTTSDLYAFDGPARLWTSFGTGLRLETGAPTALANSGDLVAIGTAAGGAYLGSVAGTPPWIAP
jgi:hypothetical protein